MTLVKKIKNIKNFNDLQNKTLKILKELNKYSNIQWSSKNSNVFKEPYWFSICLKGFLGSEQSFLKNDNLETNRYYWTRNIEYFKDIQIFLEKNFNTDIYLVRLLKLSKKSVIKPHRDISFEDKTKKIRLHIPIKTNKEVIYYTLNSTNNEIKNLKKYKNKNIREISKITNQLWDKYEEQIQTYYLDEGVIWYVNVDEIHSIKNNSNEDRIHLIVDLKPNDELRSILNI